MISLKKTVNWDGQSPVTEGLYARWLGQAGFLIRTPSLSFMIDPYLSDSLHKKYKDSHFKHERMHEVPLDPSAALGLDLVFSSHAHTDHLDPESLSFIQAANPGCRFVLPASALQTALDRGLERERIQTVNAGDVFSPAEGWTVQVLPSAHEELKTDEQGRHLYLGFFFRGPGFSFYHSGDCAPWEGMADRLRALKPDLLLLPINGRDEYRAAHGVPGNFTCREAAELTLKVGSALMGHHFEMFDFNTILRTDAEEILDSYEKLHWILPEWESFLTISTGEETND